MRKGDLDCFFFVIVYVDVGAACSIFTSQTVLPKSHLFYYTNKRLNSLEVIEGSNPTQMVGDSTVVICP